MLRLAVPNKGALSTPANDLLREAGYSTRRDPKKLMVTDEERGVQLFYLRPRDVAIYVGSGTVDAGITGRDLLADSGSPATETVALGFGKSTFRFAGRPGAARTVDDLSGRRVATSYAHMVKEHLAAQDVSATVVRLDGAVETAVSLGVADAVADVVDTGATLRSAGLEVFGEPILDSEAVLIRDNASDQSRALDVLQHRVEGVLTARSYVLVDYDVPTDLVQQAAALTPGLESPTVSPLTKPGWVAVRSLVPRRDINGIMDALYTMGARAILVTDISACRL